MNLIDLFFSIFIATLLLNFVAKTLVTLYIDVKEQLRRK